MAAPGHQETKMIPVNFVSFRGLSRHRDCARELPFIANTGHSSIDLIGRLPATVWALGRTRSFTARR